MTGIWRLRAGLLTVVGALVVHHARYQLAPPEHAHELVRVHGYLTWLVPFAAAMMFLAAAQLAVWTQSAGRPQRLELPPARRLWLAASASLLLVFSAQEALELTVAQGQPPALVELLGHLGWQLVPLAVSVGAVLALLLRGAARVVRALLGRRARARRRCAQPARPRTTLLVAPASVLARHLAGRGPPSLA